jgi:hypothetical protein
MAPSSKTKPAAGARRTEPRLDDFFAAVRDTNPFAANRITEPSAYDVDVEAIHDAAFKKLIACSGEALVRRAGVGVALLGGAGVGKSHLLSRLYRWANGPVEGGGGRAAYVYLNNILADPERLPRYLLKYVVSRLSGGGLGTLSETPLYRFVDRALRHAMDEAGIGAARVEDRLQEAFEAYRRAFGQVEETRAAYRVLLQFWRFARPEKAAELGRRNLAVSALNWLSGDEIDPSFAEHLGFKTDGGEPVMLRDDEDVLQVLLALTRLAEVSRQPLVLCVDQVENLDPDKFKPLARFLHTLLDRTTNLLMITSGVKQTLLNYHEDRVIPEAAWDRIAQYRVELNRVPRHDARKILEARLERFHEPFRNVAEVHRHLLEDTLFPLGRDWLAAQLGDGIEFRPRDVLTWARDSWEAQQDKLARLGGAAWLRDWPGTGSTDGKGKVKKRLTPKEIEAAIDGVIDRKIAEQIAQLRLHIGSLPPDAGNLAGLVETLLGQCRGDGLPYTFRGVERGKKKGGKFPPYDLLVRERREPDGREVTTGVLFVTNEGISATAALRRLLQDDPPPDHRLLVTDHERRPLKVGAQGQEYYKELVKLGPERFEHLKINFEQYAALDALREVVGMARSGDLEIESPPGTPRAVSEAEVIASNHRKDRYRGHLLLRPLLTEEPVPPLAPPDRGPEVDEKDVQPFVMAQLAWKMGANAQALAKAYVSAVKGRKLEFEAAWPQFRAIVERMHKEGLIHATPQDDDLFLLLRK